MYCQYVSVTSIMSDIFVYSAFSVGDTDNTSTLMTSLTLFIEKYEKLFKLDDAIMDDQEPKRMLEIIANTLTLLVSHIPNNIETNKV